MVFLFILLDFVVLFIVNSRKFFLSRRLYDFISSDHLMTEIIDRINTSNDSYKSSELIVSGRFRVTLLLIE